MTFVKSPAQVLVTGANGFVAAWIVQLLIERGYSVIGTVRSESKGTYLKEKFGDNFEFAVVGGLEVCVKCPIFKTTTFQVAAAHHTNDLIPR